MQPQLVLVGRTGSVNLSLIFNEKLLVIDKEVTKFLGLNRSETLSFTEPAAFYGNWVHDPDDELADIDRETALGILRFLDDASSTSDTLDIPEDEDELNLVLGVILFEGERRVLYLEHEHEKGDVEQFHLHSRLQDDYLINIRRNRRYLKV